jgi:hypothetical protein
VKKRHEQNIEVGIVVFTSGKMMNIAGTGI